MYVNEAESLSVRSHGGGWEGLGKEGQGKEGVSPGH